MSEQTLTHDRAAELRKREETPLVELVQFDGFPVDPLGSRRGPSTFRGRTVEFFRSSAADGAGGGWCARLFVVPGTPTETVLAQLDQMREWIAAGDWDAVPDYDELPF